MTAVEVLARIREYGGDISVMSDRHRLRIERRSRVPDNIATEAKAHIEELRVMLLADEGNANTLSRIEKELRNSVPENFLLPSVPKSPERENPLSNKALADSVPLFPRSHESAMEQQKALETARAIREGRFPLAEPKVCDFLTGFPGEACRCCGASWLEHYPAGGAT